MWVCPCGPFVMISLPLPPTGAARLCRRWHCGPDDPGFIGKTSISTVPCVCKSPITLMNPHPSSPNIPATESITASLPTNKQRAPPCRSGFLHQLKCVSTSQACASWLPRLPEIVQLLTLTEGVSQPHYGNGVEVHPFRPSRLKRNLLYELYEVKKRTS